MNLDWIPERSEGLLSTDTEDGTVIVSPADGRLQVVNEVGSFIWELLDGTNTVSAIIEQLTGNFEVTTEQATADVFAFLRALAERDMLIWKVAE